MGGVSPTANVKDYEIYDAKKHPLTTAPIAETSPKAGSKAGVNVARENALSTISIRDMLAGVKDAEGNVMGRVSAAERLAQDEAAWNGIVDDYEKGKINPTSTYTVMDTPLSLQLVGAPNVPSKMDGGKIGHILAYDGINADLLRVLPRAIADPVMVLVSYAERKVVVVDLKDTNGVMMIVPIDLYQTRDRIEVNILNNAYGKNPRIKRDNGSWQQVGGKGFSWFVEQNIKKNRVLYMNTKKASCGRGLLRAIPLAKVRHRRLYLPLLYQMRLRM